MRAIAGRIPWAVLIILVPSWATWLTFERDDKARDHLLFFYVPDLVERPLRLIPNLTLTPLVNTQTDQLILVTVLVGVFGTLIEWRLGVLRTLAIFWATSAVGAVLGAVLFHLVEPFLGDFGPVESVRERVYNGGSAGGYGLAGAFAATTRWLPYWALLFLAWETVVWTSIASSFEFTPVFHLIAFASGGLVVRLATRGRRGRQPSTNGASTD